ncbi:hypothetical protein HYALB_00004633 [Hymenoscyphus albidus]|uniref:Ubiquitin-like domain-containing protein n=1 Tax=Hymenoscyphus albidus TaxID=595503 RepID=A0A9N9QDJ6_9HELO|nr:hypothetical protein HYALB_00004633 [Hymenoscyphus albidus]
MTELSFAKSFLTTLDSRPSKISPDHYEDPKSYPARNAFILPKSTGPPLKRKTPASTTAQPTSFPVTLKSLRNPPLDITIPSRDLSTSILDLKTALSTEASIPVKALKLLYNKKPVADSKVLKDLLGAEGVKEGQSVEFGVMVIGGAAAIVKKDGEGVTEGEKMEVEMGHGGDVLKTDAFWEDLRGFLVQRLKDEEEGDRVVKVFRDAVMN